MPDRFTGHATAPTPAGDFRFFFSITLLVVVTLYPFSMSLAEIRQITSQGEYRMGDRDTREDAVRLATEAAKRNALEQVATYLESITVVDGADITKDEIRTYTAGLVLVLDQQTNLRLDGDIIVVGVDLTAQIDTEEVVNAIAVLRENEDARQQLGALKTEIDNLHQELESTNQALTLATTTEQVQQATQERQDILNRVQSNAIVAQAWTEWVIVAPVVYPYPWVGVSQARALLNVARQLYPNSSYVQAAQYEMVTKQPPLPLQPPASTIQPGPQQPGSRTVPLPLNEISPMRSMTPSQVTNQRGSTHLMVPAPSGSRTLTDVRQLNPLLPPHNGMPATGRQVAPPGSRSARALRQFMQPPAAAPPVGQPPFARRPPPTINQIYSSPPQHVPRTPHHVAPRSFGGGNRAGGGRGAGRGWHGSGGGHGSGRGR